MMPTINEFQKKWPGDIQRAFFFPTLDEVKMLTSSKEEQDFIVASGIPKWSAPNLHLHSIENDLSPEFHIIGEDRNANIIVVNSDSKELGWGKQSDSEGFGYICRTIGIFLIELYHYQCMVSDALTQAGPDAFVENKIPRELVLEFVRKIQRNNSSSMTSEKSFWKNETDRILKGG
jgi:hypothetical protein